MNSDLQRKLAELNTQMMNYRMGIGQNIDINTANSILSNQLTQDVIDVTPTPIPEPKPEPKVEVKTIRGARGKRGKRGAKGEKGDRGEQGPPGIAGKDGLNTTSNLKVKLVHDNYIVGIDDEYIGINTQEPITIVLPEKPEEGRILFFKLEVCAPVGNRKAIVRATGGAMIDNDFSIEMRNPYESLTIMYRGGDWYVLNHLK